MFSVVRPAACVVRDPINATDPTGLATDYSISSLSVSQEQTSYLKKRDFVNAQNRYKQLRNAACNFLNKASKTHQHHLIPEFTRAPTALVPVDSFIHLSMIHPLLNIVARMSNLPSTYAGAGAQYAKVLSTPAGRAEFARVLLTTTRIVDYQCGTSITGDTENALKSIGWI